MATIKTIKTNRNRTVEIHPTGDKARFEWDGRQYERARWADREGGNWVLFMGQYNLVTDPRGSFYKMHRFNAEYSCRGEA